MIYYRVSLSFVNAPDHLLEEAALDVISGLSENASIFPKPPISSDELKTALEDFLAAAAADQSQEGTTSKEEKRETLVELLRELARYVQVKTHDNLRKMLLSGFDSLNMIQAPSPLAKGEIRRIINAAPTEVIVEAKAQPDTKAWEGRCSFVPGEWMPSQISTKTTGMIFTHLQPGMVYQFQMRPLGNRSNVGDWSDPVSQAPM